MESGCGGELSVSVRLMRRVETLYFEASVILFFNLYLKY